MQLFGEKDKIYKYDMCADSWGILSVSIIRCYAECV